MQSVFDTRFAPSPSGRMHMGNLMTALRSWLYAKSTGGRFMLRIEDLDPQRSKPWFTEAIIDDLRWLGLTWDGPIIHQSQRTEIYADALGKLTQMGLTYPCFCRRADLLAVNAPHASDGRPIYSGRCRPTTLPFHFEDSALPPHSIRLWSKPITICFNDLLCGPQSFDLQAECGDVILRRTDGAWAYNLACAVDDALTGVNLIVRGDDLLCTTPVQLYITDLLGLPQPQYAHIPLVCNAEGKRLSKRDSALSMEQLRLTHTPHQILTHLADLAALPADLRRLLPH